MSSTHDSHHVPAPDEPSIPELEEDENVAPRPEEEIADMLRQAPTSRITPTGKPAVKSCAHPSA